MIFGQNDRNSPIVPFKITSFQFDSENLQKDPRYEMSFTQWFQSQTVGFYNQGYKSWSHGITNVSIPKMNMLKYSSTLAVSVSINLSIELDFVSVNSPRESVDANRTGIS